MPRNLYKPSDSRLTQEEIIRFYMLLDKYRKMPHYSIRNEILTFIEQMIQKYGRQNEL